MLYTFWFIVTCIIHIHILLHNIQVRLSLRITKDRYRLYFKFSVSLLIVLVFVIVAFLRVLQNVLVFLPVRCHPCSRLDVILVLAKMSYLVFPSTK